MANVVLGCDTNNSNDQKYLDTVGQLIEQAGHTVEKLSIGPNYFANYSWNGDTKGKYKRIKTKREHENWGPVLKYLSKNPSLSKNYPACHCEE